MYLQEVLFKPSWMLASEWDVCLMDAFFFLVYSNKKRLLSPVYLFVIENFHCSPSASSKTSMSLSTSSIVL